VEVLGVAASLQGQANHRVLVDTGQSAGLTDADAFLEVGQNGVGLIVGEAAIEQGGSGTLTEAVLAGAAGQVATLLETTVAEGYAKVAQAALAVVGTVGILAAKNLEFVHGAAFQEKEIKQLPSRSR
jgi:hypothetical protein